MREAELAGPPLQQDVSAINSLLLWLSSSSLPPPLDVYLESFISPHVSGTLGRQNHGQIEDVVCS